MKVWQLKLLVLSCVLLHASGVFSAPAIRCIEANDGMSQAVRVDDVPLAHTAQLLPLDGKGKLVGKGDSAAQIKQVFDNLASVLGEDRKVLERVIKLNVCATSPEVVAAVKKALAATWPGEHKPAVTFVTGKLALPDALVAMDAVAVSSDPTTSVKHLRAAAILPAGARVYVSGQAEKGDLAEATRLTLESLRKTLTFLGLKDADVVQVKAFMKPMSEVAIVERELAKHFGKQPVPPAVFVEWDSTLPIEIELIAAAGKAKENGPVIEYLTPPGMTASPVYSRVTRINAGQTIYVSGRYAEKAADAEGQVTEVFTALGKLLETTGSDFRHLAKATYYVADDAVSRKLNELRPRFYDPRRPPAASKAMVAGTGRRDRTLTLDMIAVPAPSRKRVEFTRLVAHWTDYADPDYLKFIEEAKPEIAQVGFYGAHFWSLAHTPFGKGYPAHFPKQGLAECGKWFEDLNGELHRRQAKVVGHFNVTFLVGDPDGPKGPQGFFKFYRELWDEKELGKRPVEDPLDLLMRNADGTPYASKNYSIGGMREYSACLNNPQWREVLKAWTRAGIRRGVDGYVINYFYRHNCLCPHCQKGFREYLSERHTPAQLREQFAIDDLARHEFKEIVGWHNPKESTPLRREMLRFSQISTKRAFDEVFVKYGRSLKPDLILAQWNHLGNFSQISGDERCLLPAELWGKDEDYLWYSTGGSGCFTDLAEGYLGEGTLQARYIRGTFDDKPFTLGKYEQTRTRVTIAELAANGGAPMGFYARFRDPAARQELVRYYDFLRRHDEIYRANRPHAEAVLLFPRSRVHQGDVASVDAFKEMGQHLLNQHVLFDVRPDDTITREQLAAYRLVVKVPAEKPAADAVARLSRFEAPTTVRVSASRPGEGMELTVHFVNYNRREPAKKRSPGSGIVDENPIAVEEVKADLVVPAGKQVVKVRAITPEEPEPVDLKFEVKDGRLRFTMPKFLVYAVARVELK